VALLLDTGVRIDEALTLRVSDLDFDNLLLIVSGKRAEGTTGSVFVRVAESALQLLKGA
jgi:integrase